MKKIFTLIIGLLCAQLLVAQNAYYDAQAIYRLFNEKQLANKDEAKNDTLTIDSNSIIYDETINPEMLKRVYSFINDPLGTEISEEDLDSLRSISQRISYLQESLGGLFGSVSQADIIDGTAKFVAERFKEEVTKMYIDKFRAKLKELDDLQKLAPNSYDFLQDADPFDYQSLGNELKDAFESDLENVLVNFRDNYEDLIKESDYHIPLVLTLDLGDKLIKDYHAKDIFEFLDKRYDPRFNGNDDSYKSIHRVLKNINVIQKNVQFVGTGNENRVYLTFEELAFLDTDDEIKYFVGLLKNDGADFLANTDAIEIFNKLIFPTTELIFDYSSLRKQAKTEGFDISGPSISKIPVDEYLELIQATLDILKEAGQSEILCSGTGCPFSNEQMAVAQKVMDAYKSIHDKKYHFIIPNLVSIIETIFKDNDNFDQKKLVRLLNVLKEYGAFMTAISNSENSDDVKEVIKKFALPSGSYKAKRASLSSITLTAHPGISIGSENLTGTNSGGQELSFGITAPIGFEFAWGKRGCENQGVYNFVRKNGVNQEVKSLKGSYWSIMLQVADIGAVLQYRLKDSEGEIPQDVNFAQVFSPGLFLQHGFKNTPLTFGLGVQYSPKLREIVVDETAIVPETRDANAVRVLARLTWDIPLFNLHTKKVKNNVSFL
ncbi:hypothetical protein [Ekhidna sp.]